MKEFEDEIILKVREEIVKNADEKYLERVKTFSPEEAIQYGVTYYGLRIPVTRKIASHFFAEIRKKSKREILNLCEILLQSGVSEERIIAFDWAFRLRKMYNSSDFFIFESWLKTYVTGWGSCDDFCTHAFGGFLYQFPEYFKEVKKWLFSLTRIHNFDKIAASKLCQNG